MRKINYQDQKLLIIKCGTAEFLELSNQGFFSPVLRELALSLIVILS